MRIPFNDDARSFTMDGEPAVGKKRLGRMPGDEKVGDVLLFHYPGSWNHFLADHATSFRVLPLSPTETQVTTTWLVPEDAVEGEDYTLDILHVTHVWEKTNEQDTMLVERNQVGVSSPAFEPGPYNTQHEDGTSSFVDWYCNAIKAAAADSEPKLAY
jgi:phenylpropionate dioxygenase-like ring-hydroxylating dioxygenase large terminal subunit